MTSVVSKTFGMKIDLFRDGVFLGGQLKLLGDELGRVFAFQNCWFNNDNRLKH